MGQRRRHTILIAAVLMLPPVLASVAPAGAQARTTPAPLAGPRSILRAAPGDRPGYIPPPVRASSGNGAPPPPSASVQLSFSPGFPTQAMAPVQAALDVWGGLLTSSRPITVLADYTNLGLGTLATAGPAFVYRDFPRAPVAGTWYPPALAEAISGEEISDGEYDVDMSINTRNDWYFGIDGNTPSGRYDLMSVVMHEFLHGLGFLGTMGVNGGKGSWGLVDPGQPARPDIYDRFGQNLAGQALLSLTNGSTALGNALQSGNLSFSSAKTNRATADRVRLYSPNPWDDGSSYAHFDEDQYPAGSANSLGTPFLNSAEAVHAPGPLALCMLEALGWVTPEACAPPAMTSAGGTTWFADGTSAATGPGVSLIRAYATGAVPGRTYKLVSGLDGGTGRPCMWDTVAINSSNRVASSSGFIGTTTGLLNRGPGSWQICFREEGTGTTLQITAPTSFKAS